MTIDEARQLIQKNISSGFVDPRTHEHTCREVVTYYQEHSEEQGVIRQALVEVISEYEWASASAEQLENAAYIVVNLESVEALQKLVTSVSNLDEPTGDFATVAIATIRSFPGNGKVRDLFFPALFRWLKIESIAHLAFETLCELFPDDAGAYLSALSHYHRSNSDVIQRALTHLYYRGGDTDQGASDVRSVVENFTALVDSIKMHSFFPDTFKRDVEKDILAKTLFASPEEADEMIREIDRGLNLDSDEVAEIFNEAIENAKHEMQKVAVIKRRRKALENLDENAWIHVLNLGELDDTDSIGSLIEVLKNGPGPLNRGWAAYALGRLDAYEAIPDLREGLFDEDEFIRKQCQISLRRLTWEFQAEVEIPRQPLMAFVHQMSGPIRAIRGAAGYMSRLLREEGKIEQDEERERLEAIDTHAARLGVMLDNLIYLPLTKGIVDYDNYEHFISELISEVAEQFKTEYDKKSIFQLLREHSISELISKVAEQFRIGYDKEYFFREHSISELVHQAAEQFKYVARDGNIEIRIDESIDKLPKFKFDCDAMFTVFANLIDNAVKFSYPDKCVDIKGSNGTDSVKIEISDFGIGIHEEEDEKIFIPYYRSRMQDAVRHISGSGIGLAVARGIIEEHSGKISVTNTNGSKSGDSQGQRVTFTVTLPLSQGE